MKSQFSEWGKAYPWGRPTRWLLAVVLVIVLAWVVAETVWLMLYGPYDPIPVSERATLQVAEAKNRAVLSQSQVDGWQLFGEYQGRADKDKDTPTDAPDTRLRLELLGVFKTADPEKATAIIAEKGKDAELYHIGDSIPGNASLEEVYADRVILRRAGRLETLRWTDDTLGGVSEVRRDARRRPSPPVPSGPPPQSGGAEGALQQRQTIMKQLALAPVDGGAGYALGERAPKQLIAQVGLAPGDVILSVNGHTLGREESDVAALESFKQTQQASIVVQRGDQQFTVNYPP